MNDTVQQRTTREAHDNWRVWSTDASLVVTEADSLSEARTIVQGVLSDVEQACSRFVSTSELSLLRDRSSHGVEVSPLLADLVEAALTVVSWTDGDVDPTVGRRLAELGYDRDIASLHDGVPVRVQRVARRQRQYSWRDIHLDGCRLSIPDGVELDLGASAKAFAAERAAERVHEALGCGVLVSLGGDIASRGRRSAPWQITVQDTADDPCEQVSLTPGWAIATSSTRRRRWSVAELTLHHILDPRSGLPAPETWRSVTVVAPDALRANALTTATIVRGGSGLPWLRGLGIPARLVDADGCLHLSGAWPIVGESEGEIAAVHTQGSRHSHASSREKLPMKMKKTQEAAHV